MCKNCTAGVYGHGIIKQTGPQQEDNFVR
jgi:hypothetical protein